MIFRFFSLALMLVFLNVSSKAQVNGAQFAFEFLRLPNSPHITALGGINVAHPAPDINFAFQNPALMRPALHNQISFNYNSFYSGISNSNLAYGFYEPKSKTAIALGVQYLNYGSFVAPDLTGVPVSNFNAVDYTISVAASKQYKERWRGGATLKVAQSRLAELNSVAILADVGVVYEDTANFFTFGMVAKNMGFMAKQYTAGKFNDEPLPFDLQLGLSKRFKHLPLRLFTTIHHLYKWDVRYNDPNDKKNSSVFGSADTTVSKNFGDNLFRHFIFGSEITLGKRLGITVAYNHMRRKEMALDDKKGGAGYSFGTSIYLNKFQIHYARSFYSIAGAYNEFGLNLALNKFVGGGSTWKAEYPNWEK
jgi:hypothetical protein